MSGTIFHDLLQDLRHAARSLRRAPMFSAVVIFTLAVGIGSNTAMFSVVHAILLDPLRYPDSERLYMVGVNQPPYGSSAYGITSEEYIAILDGVPAFDSIGVYDYGGGTLTGDGGFPEEPTSLSINVGFQQILGLEPLLGRAFSEQDCTVGANPVLMLGEEIWNRRYNGDVEIIGSRVLLDGEPHEVVGIVPDSFRFPDETGSFQVFRTRAMSRETQWRSVGVIARTAKDIDESVAESQLASLSAALAEKFPDSNTDRSFFARPLKQEVVGELQPALLLLWVAVGFVLLLACMNAANLLLARSAARAHEIAVCSSLGASRVRITQRVLCESVLLSLVAGAAGLLLAQWGIEGVALLGMTDLPRGDQIALDGTMFAFTLLLALLTGLLYGILPAWQAGRADLSGMMKEGGGRASLGARGQGLRWALTVGQVGVACVLLIGAGLMIRSSLVVASTEPGFETENAFGMTLWADKPRDADDAWEVRFYDEVLERIEAVPGVASAAMVSNMPWQSMFDNSVSLEIKDHPDFVSGEPVTVKWRVVSEDYLEEVGIALEEGRHLELRDDTDSPKVVLVSQQFARRFWTEGSAVGETLLVGDRRTPVQIVGVVAGIRELMLDQEPEPVVYAPFRQNPSIATTIMVHGEGKPEIVKRPVQQAVWAVEPTQGIWATRTLDDLLRAGLGRERLYTQLLVIFAVVAVLLAAVGIYGVISYSVTQRTREIGIRMALGADSSSILFGVLLRGLRLSAIGLLVGLPLAYSLVRFIENLLFKVTPLDPWTYGGVSLLVLVVATFACFVPARRATRVHPMTCLRAE